MTYQFVRQEPAMTIQSDPACARVGLRRSLTVWPLLFYGLAVIVGAGIYVAIASVIDRAGAAAPLSFLLAGAAAGMTGLCYAELASRFPEASGAAAYVKQGFGSDRAAQATGLALTLAVAIAAASIGSGAVHYLSPARRLATGGPDRTSGHGLHVARDGRGAGEHRLRRGHRRG
jgi:amino acid transporter